jgi:hypothetical protein
MSTTFEPFDVPPKMMILPGRNIAAEESLPFGFVTWPSVR